MSEEFVYDVFISYSHQDATWVRGELLRRLDAAGLKVCIDFRDFRPGAPSVTEMERAVSTSRRTLLILTPAYLASDWAKFENLMLQTLDPANDQFRLIPLLKEACELPLRIGYLTYLNFVKRTDLQVAWRQLLTALGAAPPLEADATPTPAHWALIHPYPMPPHFTGRSAERQQLRDWLARDANHPLLIVRALGGFGKSALSWHWLLHDVEARRWPQVLWWSFYEGDVSFEGFLREILDYLQLDPRPRGPRQQVEALLTALRRPGLLLILDGFERQLRAFAGLTAAYQGDEISTPPQPSRAQGAPEGGSYDLVDVGSVTSPHRGRLGGGGADSTRQCISPLAEHFLGSVATLPGMQGKVLLTTRLRPNVLETHGESLLAGCQELALTQMQPADAVALFRALGVRGNRGEIESACEPYGYHPLSLRLLAGWVVNDLQTPGDIAAAQRLHLHDDLVQRQHHVLEQAYGSLTPARRTLLSRIACFRFGVEYKALQALAEQTTDGNFDADLRDLLSRGLLQRDPHSRRFDLHPIVRHYAYERLGHENAGSAHRLLISYFQAVPAVQQPQHLDDLQPIIELYHHTLAAGQYDEARLLYRDTLSSSLYFQFGAYQIEIQLLRGLFPDGEEQLPRLKDEAAQAWTLNSLALSYAQSGQPHSAVRLFERQIVIRARQGNKQNLAIGLGNLAPQQFAIGALQAAAANLRRGIALCHEIKEEFYEASEHRELGRLLAYTEMQQEAEEELKAALLLFKKRKHVQGQGVTWAYHALRGLLLARADQRCQRSFNLSRQQLSPHLELVEGEEGWGRIALAAAWRALDLADETTNDSQFVYPIRDYIQAYWLLGAAQRLQGDHTAAEPHLLEALTRCRNINLVEMEADILIDLARLRVDQGESEAAQALAGEALAIAERCGYVLQMADAYLELAKLALARNARTAARTHAQQAYIYATCDGPPDWTYKVAYDEACALLQALA